MLMSTHPFVQHSQEVVLYVVENARFFVVFQSSLAGRACQIHEKSESKNLFNYTRLLLLRSFLYRIVCSQNGTKAI